MSASRLPCAKTGPIKACGEGSEFGAQLHLNRLLSSLVLLTDRLSPYTHQQEWTACVPFVSVVDCIHLLSSPCSISACSHDISCVMTSYTRVGDIIAHGSNVRSSSLAIGESFCLTVTAIVPNLQSDGRAFGHGHRVQEVPHLPSSQAHYAPS
jgi:hypothetical protein